MPSRPARQVRPRRPRSRAQILVGLTAALALVFGVTAWRTATADRHNIENATCMFAADAARELQTQSQLYLASAAEPLFGAVGGHATVSRSERVASPVVLAQAAQRVKQCHCAPVLPASLYFAFDVADGALTRLTVASPDAGDTTQPSGTVSQVSYQDTVGLRQSLTSVLSQLQGAASFAAAVRDSGPRVKRIKGVAVSLGKYDTQGHLRAVYGLIVPPLPFVRSVIIPVFDSVPVFDEMQADTSSRRWDCCHQMHFTNHDVANLEVDDTLWRPLVRTGTMPDTVTGCLGEAMPMASMAGVWMDLGPLPHTFARWVGRTLTVSRAPLLWVLLAAMLVCGAAAAITGHREAELAALRSDFVTSISHELRMPLAQILLAGETLSLDRTRSQAERDDAADAVVREAQRLTGLVDNVLFFSRIEHHNVQTTPTATNLAEVVSDIVACVAPLAAGARASINAAVPTDAVAMLDRSAFRQVLYNLLDNAFKYGSPGQHVFIGVDVPPAAPDRVRIWVEDEGPGIPRGQESAIFDPFVRLGRDTEKAVAGSGLGLAVVRSLVTSQGGRIWVERPASGRGTRFVIELRREESTNGASPPGSRE
jgi:signal transduction histidine kinase